MIFLDVNNFFVDRAGGIRTYHLERIEWFRRRPEHTYIVVGPGSRRSEEKLAPNVIRAHIWGIPLGREEGGYRLMMDLPGLRRLIRKYRPDVVEAGDPWVSGHFMLLLKLLRQYCGPLEYFYHSDPVRTYLEPWAGRGGMWRRLLIRLPAFLIRRIQQLYQRTRTASEMMRDQLLRAGIRRVACTPFGAPEAMFRAMDYRVPGEEESLRIIYAGRLHPDKGVDILPPVLMHLLRNPRVEVTVAGRGHLRALFENDFFRSHPRFRLLDYIHDQDEYRHLLRRQHLYLAPGPWETFGLAVLEAMALGLPVVGPDQGGTAELLHQIPGALIFEAGNPDSMIRCVEKALSSDLAELSRAHRKQAEQYGTWETAIERMITDSMETLRHAED